MGLEEDQCPENLRFWQIKERTEIVLEVTVDLLQGVEEVSDPGNFVHVLSWFFSNYGCLDRDQIVTHLEVAAAILSTTEAPLVVVVKVEVLEVVEAATTLTETVGVAVVGLPSVNRRPVLTGLRGMLLPVRSG